MFLSQCHLHLTCPPRHQTIPPNRPRPILLPWTPPNTPVRRRRRPLRWPRYAFGTLPSPWQTASERLSSISSRNNARSGHSSESKEEQDTTTGNAGSPSSLNIDPPGLWDCPLRLIGHLPLTPIETMTSTFSRLSQDWKDPGPTEMKSPPISPSRSEASLCGHGNNRWLTVLRRGIRDQLTSSGTRRVTMESPLSRRISDVIDWDEHSPTSPNTRI